MNGRDEYGRSASATPPLTKRAADYIAWLAGRCSGCFRRGAGCRSCACEAARGLHAEIQAAGTPAFAPAAAGRIEGGAGLRQRLTLVREALVNRLIQAHGGWVGSAELYAAAARAGASQTQTSYQIDVLIKSGAAERRGPNKRSEYRLKPEVIRE